MEDHCAAIDAILRKGEVGRVYNVGGRSEKRNIDVVRTLCRLVEQRFAAEPSLKARFPKCPAAEGQPVESLITYVTDRLGHDWRYAIDTARIERELGFEPAHRFETGIEDTITWYLGNEGWWRKLLKH